MSFICFFCGCAWMLQIPVRIGNEDLMQQRCSRCGSNRYVRPAESQQPGR